MGSKQLYNNAGLTLVRLPQFHGTFRHTEGCSNRRAGIETADAIRNSMH